MQRGMTGEYEVRRIGGETVKAFVPKPLPPEPLVKHEPSVSVSASPPTAAPARFPSLSPATESGG